MSHPITASQIRAARTYLNWSQDQLADATGLGKTTIRSLEAGHISIQSALKVRRALESFGIEFTEGEGVRRRADGVKVFRSPRSCDEFFQDVLETARQKGGEILIMTTNEVMLMRALGAVGSGDPKPLRLLGEEADMRCLLIDRHPVSIAVSALQFRVLPAQIALGAKNYVLYGDKVGLICAKRHMNDFSFVVIDMPWVTEGWREDFTVLWDVAMAADMRLATNVQRMSPNLKYLDTGVEERRVAAE